MKWCALDTWNKSTAKKRKELLDFGKFSMMTLIGSNLLRSSDTFIIDAFLGSRAVAVYTIPQKLIDIIEIPIRSIVVSALPQLSSLQNEEKHEQFSKVLQQFTGILSLTILPLCLLLFLFAEPLVVLIGGEAYRDSAIILRILAIYTVFLPFDRFTGITFDVLGRPMINTLKVFVMLLVNVGGDIFAIKTAGVGHEVTGVALISIATFFSGVVFGVLFLKRLISFSVLGTLKRGFTDYRIMIQMIRSKVKPH
jgi:O-antigen/teichoic acid export membrane protein